MTPETIDLWLKIATSTISIAAFGVALFATRRKHIDERMEAGSKRMDAHDMSIQAIQGQLKTMPGKDDLHRLELLLATMNGELGRMSAHIEANGKMMETLSTVISRHEDHLLKGAK